MEGNEGRGKRKSTIIGIPFQHSLKTPDKGEWEDLYEKGGDRSESEAADALWTSTYVSLCKQSPILMNSSPTPNPTAKDDVSNILRDWNNEYQHLLSSNQSHDQKRRLLQKLVDEFREEVEPIVETIAQELYWDEKTLKAEGEVEKATNNLPVAFYSCANLIFHLSADSDLPSRVVRNSATVASLLLYKDFDCNAGFSAPFCGYFTYGAKTILVAAKVSLSDGAEIVTNTPRAGYCTRLISATLGREVSEQLFIHGQGGYYYLLPRGKLFPDDCPLVLAAKNPFSEKTKEELISDAFQTFEAFLLDCKNFELPLMLTELDNHGIPLDSIGHLIEQSEALKASDSKPRSILIAIAIARCIRQVAVIQIPLMLEELNSQEATDDDVLTSYFNRYFQISLSEDEELFSSIVAPLASKVLSISPQPVPRYLHKSFVKYLGELLGLATVSHKVVSTSPVLMGSVVSHLINFEMLDNLTTLTDIQNVPQSLTLLHQVRLNRATQAAFEEEPDLYTASACCERFAVGSSKLNLALYKIGVEKRKEAISDTPNDRLELIRMRTRMASYCDGTKAIKLLEESVEQLEHLFQKDRSLKDELKATLTLIVRMLRHIGNRSGSETYASKLISLVANSKSAPHETAAALALHAAILLDQDKLEQTDKELTRGLSLYEGISEENPEATLAKAELWYLKHRMSVERLTLSSQRDYVAAVEIFEKLAEPSSTSSHPTTMICALGRLGHLRLNESPEIAKSYFMKAVELASQLYPAGHFERKLTDDDLKFCLRREGIVILQSFCRSRVASLRVESKRKKKKAPTTAAKSKSKSTKKKEDKSISAESFAWEEFQSPPRDQRQSPPYSPPKTRSPFANSVGDDEPIPIQPPRSSTPVPTTQLAPLGAPRTAASYSYLASKCKLPLPGIKSSQSLSALRGSRSLVVQKCQKSAECDYRWWSNKTRLLQAKLGSIQRHGERQSANDVKQQFVSKQQADISTQMDLKSKLANIELSQKRETVRSAREDQRAAIKDARQQLFGRKSQLRYRGLKESQRNKLAIEKTSLKNRKDKIEAANQVKLQRLIATKDRTNRTLQGEFLAQSNFEEKIQGRLQAQKFYEDETISLVQASSVLLKQLRALHIRQQEASG